LLRLAAERANTLGPVRGHRQRGIQAQRDAERGNHQGTAHVDTLAAAQR
jgi:hypothetical protein